MHPVDEVVPERPWHPIPIRDRGATLKPLPAALHRLLPHPYGELGAPYGPGADPFHLRIPVVRRLLKAQDLLQRRKPRWRLAIFDAWRPVVVQAFMVAYARRQECERRGIDPQRASPEREAAFLEVSRFWADPSENPRTPPPHSTGAAVDLTLATADGIPLDMGGVIDATGPISEPDHHAAAARLNPSSPAGQVHKRRVLLRQVMNAAGFAQHPNEWWHFSWGDQLWAWRKGCPAAHFGGIRASAGAGQVG